MGKKKSTSLNIDEDLWAEFKAHCAHKRADMSDVLERLLREELGKPASSQKKP